MAELALVALGSNIEPERNLPAAVAALRARAEVVSTSSAWATAAVGPPGQPAFLNAAVRLQTDLPAARLRDELLHGIERELGRVRTTDRYAPRPIDLDLTAYGVQRLRLGDREVPDPELLREAFLAVPAAEVAPDWVHPVTGETLAAIAARLVAALPADHQPRRTALRM